MESCIGAQFAHQHSLDVISNSQIRQTEAFNRIYNEMLASMQKDVISYSPYQWAEPNPWIPTPEEMGDQSRSYHIKTDTMNIEMVGTDGRTKGEVLEIGQLVINYLPDDMVGVCLSGWKFGWGDGIMSGFTGDHPNITMSIDDLDTLRISGYTLAELADIRDERDDLHTRYPVGTRIKAHVYDEGEIYEVVSREEYEQVMGETIEAYYLPVKQIGALDLEDIRDAYDGFMEAHIDSVAVPFPEVGSVINRFTVDDLSAPLFRAVDAHDHQAGLGITLTLMDEASSMFGADPILNPEPQGVRKPKPRYGWYG